VSPHLIPLAKALAARLSPVNFCYVADEKSHAERLTLGWGENKIPEWVLFSKAEQEGSDVAEKWKHDADAILCGKRELDLFEARCQQGKVTCYMSERWFKPPYGMLRMLHPQYLRMALRFCQLLHSPKFFYLPMGVPAAEDLVRMVNFFSFFPKWLFRRSPLTIHECRSKLLLWGYFVEPSSHAPMHARKSERLRVLWVGRMLNWKRVDTLIKAVGALLKEGRNIRLTLVGLGPEEPRLRKLAESINNQQSAFGNATINDPMNSRTNELPVITIYPPVPIVQVRDLMRQSDVYVLPSDGGEGWGAVVNEAMEEGCVVVASRECGSGATMIEQGQNGLLFKAGSIRELIAWLGRLCDETDFREQLAQGGLKTMRTLWNPDVAAERLVSVCEAARDGRETPHYDKGPLRVLPC
jgi:glycosyltransferase involved in cell wall biosynthesis